ncbi:sugar phosphate isomerase/epimerase family protein [Paenibacillus tarimensis]
MSVGVLAHLFGCLPYRQLAAEVGAYGFRHVQLALWKAIQDVDFSRPGKLSPGLAMDIGEQFDRHGVTISVLGCYVHLYDRNEEVRRVNIERFKELLRYARFFGCPIVAAETGVNPGGDYTDADWRTMRATLEELVEEAEKWGTFIGLEAAGGHLIGTAQSLKEMLDEVPSTSIGVVLDPGNLLAEDNIRQQDSVIEEAFGLLGERIIACHAKDRKVLADGRVHTVTPGQGDMNYGLYMKLLNQFKPNCHIIMEAAKKDEMRQSKSFIETVRNQIQS